MNILVAILTDKWQEVATSKELYALKSMADVIVTEDHKMTAAGPTTKKRFIHVVRCAHYLQWYSRWCPCCVHCDKPVAEYTPCAHEYTL